MKILCKLTGDSIFLFKIKGWGSKDIGKVGGLVKEKLFNYLDIFCFEEKKVYIYCNFLFYCCKKCQKIQKVCILLHFFFICSILYSGDEM